MWRIYSRVQNTKRVNHTFFPDEGVRLRTTARKLVNCLADGMGAANLKRDPFRHESEVRLLYIDADRRIEGQPSIEVPIDGTQ
jgi:hypothetical protein